MIDFVHLFTYHPVEEAVFKPYCWRYFVFTDGTPVIYHHVRQVWIRYYPLTGKWTIVGKLITLLYDTQVCNVDDIYGPEISIFVHDVNEYLQTLLSAPIIDVRDFETSRIDYCFNVRTPHVHAYLDVLNEGFRMTNTGSRINFTEQKKLTGSAYIKTRADYEGNTRRNYVLNYYDKFNRLEFLHERGAPIQHTDWWHAADILRFEVQCGYIFIKELCRKLSITRCFGDLLSFDVAYRAESIIYERVFRANATQDFFTYHTAKKLLTSKAALHTLETSAEHHRITGSNHAQGRKLIKAAGVYPFAFLKKGDEAEKLENPLKLIQKKLAGFGVTLMKR